MSIMELGALGEFVASMVVLVTLIYLTMQVKQTKELAQQASLESRNTNVREMFLAVASSDRLTPAMAKANEALRAEYSRPVRILMEEGNLTLEEAMRLEAWNVAMVRNHQTQYRTYAPEDERDALNANVRRAYTGPVGRLFWEHFRDVGSQSPDFVAHVDKLLAEGGDDSKVFTFQ